MTSPQIPQRFVDELVVHLLRNLQPEVTAGNPLILGIHGPPGDGKTYQTEYVLRSAGVELVLVSGGQLESGIAGEPAQIVRSAYLEAGAFIRNGCPAVLLLNDADAAIGSWGPLTQYTVNTQNVVTELMHLADYPTVVEGRSTPRVPVVLTGNDFTRLYGPLRRHGRMELFEWVPTAAERLDVLDELFPAVARKRLSSLLRAFPGRPISFWTTVRHRHEREVLLELSRRQPLDQLLKSLLAGYSVRAAASTELDVDRIEQLAREILANDSADHLSNTVVRT